MRYKAWGETRFTSGTTPTDFNYTGQRQESDLGFYYYKARWYDPALGRFMQADTIVPDPGNPMSLDRYAYVYNNPIIYTDPLGHDPNDVLPTGTPTPPGYLNPLNVSPVSTPVPGNSPTYVNEPEPYPVPSPFIYAGHISPPDFGNVDTDGRPPPPEVDGLPNDEWEWNPPGTDNLPGGWRNRSDRKRRVYQPDDGYNVGHEGEQPHWDVHTPGKRGAQKLPPHPEWGRRGQRSNPGVYDPGSGTYKLIIEPSRDNIIGGIIVFGVPSAFTYGLWWLGKMLAPLCGPLAPVCAVGL